jgi:hypothetical protein
MTEPENPDDVVSDATESREPAESAAEPDVTAESPAVAEPMEPVAADTVAEPTEPEPAVEPTEVVQAVAPEPPDSALTPEPAAEPTQLPDESHSRTSELAARLRQSALAQVEAARVAAQAGATGDQPAVREESAPPAPSIPSLDDPVSHPDERAIPAMPVMEPVAVAAAAMAEAATADEQSYLNGPLEPAEGASHSWLRLVTAAVGLLTIAAVVLLVIFIHSASHDSAVAKARVAALAAAKTETAAALTYNYQTLDADFARAEAGMSTSFRATYARTASSEVTPLAQKTHAVTTATIVAGGVISATPDSAKVLMFADQTVQNNLLNATSRLDRSVIEVPMIKQNGRWVINGLNPF